MKYIGIGKCLKYNFYILVAFISEFIIELLFGLNPSNSLYPLRLFPINPKLYKHPLFKNFINFIAILSGGIILYFLQKPYNKKKEGEISISTYERIKSQILGQKKRSTYFSLIIIGLLFSIYIILSDFSGIKLWMFEIVYICLLSTLLLKVKINNHKKIAIFIMIGPLSIISIISFCLPRKLCEDNEKCNKNAFETIKSEYANNNGKCDENAQNRDYLLGESRYSDFSYSYRIYYYKKIENEISEEYDHDIFNQRGIIQISSSKTVNVYAKSI